MKNSAKCQSQRQHGIMGQKTIPNKSRGCMRVVEPDHNIRCSEKLETINHQHELHL